MITALLTLLLAGPASAGEISVTGLAPLILVDGVTVDLSGNSLGYVARDLSAGRHVLEARTLTGTTIALSYIDVPADKRVNVSYKKKIFTVTGQSPLAGATTSSAPPSKTGAASGAGSVAFRGLDPASYRVELAGKTVAYQPEWGAYIATDLRPGSYPVSLYRMGKLVMAGDVAVSADAHAICTLEAFPLGVAGECNNAGPALPTSEIGATASVGGNVSTTTTSAGGAVQVVLTTPSAEGQAPAPPPAPSGPKAMDEASLQSLVSTVEKATFSDAQVDVLRTAAAHNSFTAAQVVRLIEPIHFSADRINAIKALAPKVIDPQNAHVIEDALTFSSEKEEVRKLFR